MGSKLAEIGASLDVKEDDITQLGRRRRRETLAVIAQALVVIASPILGIIVGELAYPPGGPSRFDPYPYAPLVLASLTIKNSSRRRWMAVSLLSVGLFIAGFLLVALSSSGEDDNYGMSPKYGVFSKSEDA